MSLRNPTQGPRIVPFGTTRAASDVLPNGRPAFRVTQRFGDPDAYFPGQRHGAIDLGNYSCGDTLLAAVAGTIRNVKDSYGALITEIVEPSGAKVGYGHLSRFARANGEQVIPGMVIGFVGDTGLGGVCHCHFYRKGADGQLVDPWPLLEQNAAAAASLRARLTGNGINVRAGSGSVGGAMNSIYAVTVSDRIRRANDRADLGAVTSYFPARSAVRGAWHGIAPYPDQWVGLYLASGWRYVARPLVRFG